jgi:hypothetical protein
VSGTEELAAKRQHERLRLSEFVAYLRAEGRSVSDATWDDAPDAWVELDGRRTALELGCGYATSAKELWHQPLEAGVNLHFSSSGNEQLAATRVVVAARISPLVADLELRLIEKCRARYGRSYLVLDGSHDRLDAAIPLSVLTSKLQVPDGCGFTGIYLVEPHFETPRRFVLLGGSA